ncbi:ABC transporter permease [Priestia megaterium]|nr:ABC transporter permease [Priestia megaterium]
MFNLIQNEHMKWFYKKSTKVVFITIAVLTLLMALVMRNIVNNAGVQENAVGFLSFSSNFLIIIQFFAIVVAGSMVAKEFEAGTIKLLLIRPAKRSTILLSKYVTSIMISLYYIGAFFFFSFIWGVLFFGVSTINSTSDELQNIAFTYGIFYIEIFMMMTFALMLSSVFRNSALAVGLSIVVGIGAKMLAQILAEFQVQWGKILLFANTNLLQYTDGNQPLFEGMTLGFSLFMIMAHFVFFVSVAWFFFLKRDVAN